MCRCKHNNNDQVLKQVMEMPMTLPSGHTVDRSTLDK